MNVSFSFVILLLQQAAQSGLRLLTDGQNFAKVSLRRSQFGLLVFLRGLVFGEQVFDLSCGSAVINRLLQGIPFRIGRTAITATALTTATATTPASARTRGHLGIRDFLNQRLNRIPVGVVGHLKCLPVIVHHALLERSRVKVSATATAATATATATATTTTIATTTAAGLRFNCPGNHAQKRGDAGRH
jgi:hypothetical protein